MRFMVRAGVGLVMLVMLGGVALARDEVQRHSIELAMQSSVADGFEGVDFYFGEQVYAEVVRSFGIFTTKRSTNAFNKSDYYACQWAFLSAIKTLYERALQEGGGAVVDIKSVTTGKMVASDTEYVCRVGNVVAKVYLEGDVVVLQEEGS